MASDTWNPAQYDKFRREREQPFFDLLALVRPAEGMRVVDLGCGTGRLTRLLHEQLHAGETLGLDRSARMLDGQRNEPLPQGLRFEVGAIEDFPAGRGPFDLIFSNAAFHWVERHDALLERLAGALNRGGQLAFQIPASFGDTSHIVAEEVAATEPFRSAYAGWRRAQPVLTPEAYARLLYRLGFHELQARLIVYPHVLAGRAEVIEWMKGTLLTEYTRHLPEPRRDAFVDAYRARLLERLDDARPFFFPFKRILCWGKRPA